MENPQHPESCIVFYYFVTRLAQWRIESNTVRRFQHTVSPVIKYKRVHIWRRSPIGRGNRFRPYPVWVRIPPSSPCSVDYATLNRRSMYQRFRAPITRGGALCKGHMDRLRNITILKEAVSLGVVHSSGSLSNQKV